MLNLIGCFLSAAIGLLLSQFEFIDIREAQMITILGWFISLYVLKY